MNTNDNKNVMFAVVIPAAGSGSRFGGADKLLAGLHGRSVLGRAVGLFAGRADVGQIVIVTGREKWGRYGEELRGEAQRHGGTEAQRDDYVMFVEGGRDRWESVLLGLRAVREDLRYVAVHDAARPLTPPEVIDAAFAGAVAVGGSVPVVAEPATLKRLGPDGRVLETVPRAGLFQAQTPQCFDRAKLVAGYEELRGRGKLAGITDDAQVFELMGWSVAATAGDVRNLKITTAQDVALAEALLTKT